MTERQEKISAILRKISAIFFSRESDNTSMITVTKTGVSKDMKRATIYISIYPDEKESAALSFAKRKRGELRRFISENTKMKILPIIDIEIDHGEKNRQHIEKFIEKERK